MESLEPRLLLSATPLEYQAPNPSDPVDLLLKIEDVGGTPTVQVLDDGAIVASQPLAATSLVRIIGSDSDDAFTMRSFDFDAPSVHFEGGTGNDRLVIEHAGGSSHELTHSLTGPQHGSFSAAQGNAVHTYGGIEQVELGTLADSHSIEPTNDANLTLAQDLDGNLVAMIQHAFDAQTDLGALDGGDGFTAAGTTADGQFGHAVSRAGDMNADGFDDVLVGAPGLDTAYVLFGSDQGFAADLDLSSLDGSNGFILTGPAGQNVGYAVGGGGDVNADGFADVIIGDPDRTAASGRAPATWCSAPIRALPPASIWPRWTAPTVLRSLA